MGSGESRRIGNGELHDMVYGRSHEELNPSQLLGRYMTQLEVALNRKDVEAITTAETQLSALFDAHPELRDQNDHEQ